MRSKIKFIPLSTISSTLHHCLWQSDEENQVLSLFSMWPISFKTLFRFTACLVHVFKNWKLLFENICKNTCGWKSALKYMKCCLKTENGCLKIQTKHPLNNLKRMLFYRKKKVKKIVFSWKKHMLKCVRSRACTN